MKWITREHVKVDRVACPWLIKQFVDKDAEFLVVPNDQMMGLADREGAIPYDLKYVELGHHDKACSFKAILKKYNVVLPQARCCQMWYAKELPDAFLKRHTKALDVIGSFGKHDGL
jgi:hypothetical protein